MFINPFEPKEPKPNPLFVCNCLRCRAQNVCDCVTIECDICSTKLLKCNAKAAPGNMLMCADCKTKEDALQAESKAQAEKRVAEAVRSMTPQEALFSKLFNHEKSLVKDMDDHSLKAHREELAQIAFEARVRLSAVDDEDKERRKRKPRSETIFDRNLNIDDTSREAINKIKERQKKMTKTEKAYESMVEMYMKAGMTREAAEKEATALTSAGVVKARLSNQTEKEREAIVPNSEKPKPFVPEELRFVNPFELNKEKKGA